MAIKWDNIEQSKQIGSSSQGNGMAARRQQDMATMGRMLELASKTDPQTLLGYGLGKLIRGAIDHRQRVKAEEQSLGYDAGMLDRAGALNSQIQDIDSQISGLQQPQASPAQDVGQGLPTMQEAFSGYAYANANNGNSMEAALARRGAPANPQFFPMPQDGKQTADMAMRDGLQQEQRENQINQLSQQRAQAQQELERLQSSYMGAARQDALAGQTRLVTGLLGQMGEARQLYDTAKGQGNEEGMAMAQQAANQVIEQARGMGIDISNAANMSLQDIQQAMAQADMSFLSNSLTPDEYARQRYLQYRYRDGMGHTQAREAAGHDAAQYQADMLGRNQSAFFTYGMDSNGAMTPAGIQMLTKMAQYGGQDVANVYANMLPGAKDAYNFGNQQRLAATQHGYKQEDMRLGAGLDMEKETHKFNLGEIKSDNDLDRQLRAYEAKLNIKRQGTLEDIKMRAAIVQNGGLPFSEEQAANFILTGNLNAKGGSGKGDGVSQTKLAETEGDLQTLIRQFMDGSIDTVDEFREKIAKPLSILNDKDTNDAMEKIITTRNFLKEYNLNFEKDKNASLNTNTKTYYETIRNDPQLMAYVPAEIRNHMEELLANEGGSEAAKTQESEKRSYSAPELTEEGQAMADDINRRVTANKNKGKATPEQEKRIQEGKDAREMWASGAWKK